VNTHRWPRATTSDNRWGRICECGNLKTDQALTCTDCAADRRRAPDHWGRRTCPQCDGPKHKDAARCRSCENAARLGDSRWYFGAGGGSEEHPWRKRQVAA
jgi:predicted amidophosphoribosyltransferase